MRNHTGIGYASATDIGLRREVNEDHLLLDAPPDARHHCGSVGVLFAVADGMGGHACGELASRMACQGMEGALHHLEARPEIYRRHLQERFFDVDARLKARGAADPACAHMGTTLAVLAMGSGFAVAAHVGDSRIYRRRGDRLMLLTTDHTFVQEMIAEGELTPEAAATHPLRHMLTRALGTIEPLDAVDTLTADIAPGDRFLLSSDGLHDALSFEEIERILGEGDGLDALVDRMVALALARGGRDNISVIVVDIPAHGKATGFCA